MKALTLAAKDLRLYARDRTGLLLGLGLPLVLAVIFGTAMGAMGGGGSPRVRLVVEDRDGSEASRALVSALEASPALRVVSVAAQEAERDPEEGARGQVAAGEAPAGLRIEAGYGQALQAGGAPRLRLFRDPSQQVEGQVLAGALVPVCLEAFGGALGGRLAADGLALLGFPADGLDEAREVVSGTWERLAAIAARSAPREGAGRRAAASPGTDGEPAASTPGLASGGDLLAALGLETEDVLGGGDAAEAQRLGQSAHAVAGIAVMMLLFGLVACGSTLREEEEQGTLDRLRLAGSDGAILGGKFLFTWVVGITQLVLLFAFGALIFDVPFFRDPLALFLLSASVAAAATGFGILFAATCSTRKQVEGVSTLVILAMSAAGGSWFPLFLTPEWFQRLGHFTLNAWAMDGYHGLFLYDQGLAGIRLEIGVLCAIAAGTSLGAAWLWRRRLAR